MERAILKFYNMLTLSFESCSSLSVLILFEGLN